MRYILNERYRLRGWYQLPDGLFDNVLKRAVFPERETYLLLLKCDGAHDFEPDGLSEKEKKILRTLEDENIIRPARYFELLLPEQSYKVYPARYREEAHWSITGACNLRCIHCFMSAPHARHGSPSHADILKVVDQLAECGVCRVGITGGEPLIREDFLDIVDALLSRDIGISTIYTNGWLVEEELLHELEKRDLHTGFQLSFDGAGCHDFLRGVPGAEERTLNALKLLKSHEYTTAVSMCLHQKNKHTIRESVRLMASFGVRGMKINAIMPQGEWTLPKVRELKMTFDEEMAIFEEYIPQYFEDNAPLGIMLGGAFMYTPGENDWSMFYEQRCTQAEEQKMLSCGILGTDFYIGADGMVAPCMGMCDTGYARHFPNLKETPLQDILRDSELVGLCYTKVGDIRNAQEECRKCDYIDRCTGGCRNAALVAGGDYLSVDPAICAFFKNGWERRIRDAVRPAFEDYIKRCPPAENLTGNHKDQKADICP